MLPFLHPALEFMPARAYLSHWTGRRFYIFPDRPANLGRRM